MKTPEQLAEEWCETWYQQQASDGVKVGTERAFLAGYQAARLNSEGISSTQSIGVQAAKDQLADADKVMPQWISVKERLPNLEKTSRSLRRESTCILIVSYGNVYVAHLCEDWSDRNHFIFEACTCNCRAFDMDIDEWKLDQVTHWMPLPEPPEDK